MTYENDLLEHLKKYKRDSLKITSNGIWKNCPDREYEHILPNENRFMNILEPFREDFQFEKEKGEFKFRLDDLTHLNSSQAMGINLFYPFHFCEWYSPFLKALEIDSEPIKLSCFEKLMSDQTNVDVFIQGESGRRLLIEIKLKENGFGRANCKSTDYQSIFETLAQNLVGVIKEEYLKPEYLKKHYQLFRYLSFLSQHSSDIFCLIVPRRNEYFQKEISVIDNIVVHQQRRKVKIAYLEDIVNRLITDLQSHDRLLQHFISFKEKNIKF